MLVTKYKYIGVKVLVTKYMYMYIGTCVITVYSVSCS